MRRPFIAGNWKMHKTLAEARTLVRGVRAGLYGGRAAQSAEVLICPPFPHLHPLREEIAGSALLLGAQNASHEPQGAFTGEVSVPMLADAGCTHVIIGHSERRQIFGEDNAVLHKKVRAVLRHDLAVIYCVGETLAQREGDETWSVVRGQLHDVLDAGLNWSRVIVAYEPVWAIGTGCTATPEQAQEVHAFIRAELATLGGRPEADSVRILYGGSVKAANAAGLLSQPDIDGALVGGASLVAEEFLGIVAGAI